MGWWSDNIAYIFRRGYGFMSLILGYDFKLKKVVLVNEKKYIRGHAMYHCGGALYHYSTFEFIILLKRFV